MARPRGSRRRGGALRGRTGRSLAGASAGVLVVCVLAGWARVAVPDPFPPVRGVGPGPAVLEGLVGGVPEIEGPRTRFPLVLQRVGGEPARPAAGALPLSLYGAAPPVAPGERVRVTGEVRVAPAVPEPRDRAPRAPRGERRATSRPPARRRWSASRPGPSPGGSGRGSGSIARSRPTCRRSPARSWKGLLIGERRQLPPTLLARLPAGRGLSRPGHLRLQRRARRRLGLPRPPPRCALPAALAAVPGARDARRVRRGGRGPALRAAGDHHGRPLPRRGPPRPREPRVEQPRAALLALLALDPGSLAEPGLQLSFAATAGLLHLGPWIRARLPPWCPGPDPERARRVGRRPSWASPR